MNWFLRGNHIQQTKVFKGNHHRVSTKTLFHCSKMMHSLIISCNLKYFWTNWKFIFFQMYENTEEFFNLLSINELCLFLSNKTWHNVSIKHLILNIWRILFFKKIKISFWNGLKTSDKLNMQNICIGAMSEKW